jgi:thiol-disulfide isomerase/thioredoxin
VLPEQNLLTEAGRIAEIQERLKELRRIKAAYPQSPLMGRIDSMLLSAASQNAKSLTELIAAQKQIISSGRPENRLGLISSAADMAVGHANAADFSKPALLKAVQDYKAEGLKLIADPKFVANIPQDRQSEIFDRFKNQIELPVVKALLMNGEGAEALAILEEYGKEGVRNASFYTFLAEASQAQGRDAEALEAYFGAIVDGNVAATEKAKALYAKIYGSEAGFDTALGKHQRLPAFQAPKFMPPDGWQWKGKAVLAEVFTGSECPPCVSAAYSFEGLKESYPPQYIAILKYHLPIPRYDPMMNPATKARQDYYGVNSTPTAFVDGTARVSVGGPKSSSLEAFNNLKKEIDAVLDAPVDVAIKAKASIGGDVVTVKCEFSNVIEGTDYHVALVQTEERFQGYNGVPVHKMVVRAIQTLQPTDRATVTFNIRELEKAAADYITEWGGNDDPVFQQRRIQSTPPNSWPQQNNIIDRSKLKAVVFVQNTETKQVYNAFTADAKKNAWNSYGKYGALGGVIAAVVVGSQRRKRGGQNGALPRN